MPLRLHVFLQVWCDVCGLTEKQAQSGRALRVSRKDQGGPESFCFPQVSVQAPSLELRMRPRLSYAWAHQESIQKKHHSFVVPHACSVLGSLSLCYLDLWNICKACPASMVVDLPVSRSCRQESHEVANFMMVGFRKQVRRRRNTRDFRTTWKVKDSTEPQKVHQLKRADGSTRDS